jgi:hypothetical protein
MFGATLLPLRPTKELVASAKSTRMRWVFLPLAVSYIHDDNGILSLVCALGLEIATSPASASQSHRGISCGGICAHAQLVSWMCSA